jgi:thiosulfate/3-mercaptopyruvate sulfurtransferase
MNRKKMLLMGAAVACISMVFITVYASDDDFGAKKGNIRAEYVAIKITGETIRGGYQLIDGATLKQWMDEKKDMLIVDTMPYDDSYKKQHIPGAVQFEFPKEEMKDLPAKMSQDYQNLLGPDKNRTIVVYCGYVTCARSHNAAMFAVKLGYKNVYRFTGGILGWKEAEYPVEKSDK